MKKSLSLIATLIGIIAIGGLMWLTVEHQQAKRILSSQNQRITTIPKVKQKQKIIELGDVRSACLSPDGNKIAFIDEQGLWVMDLKQRSKELIRSHPKELIRTEDPFTPGEYITCRQRFNSPQWSPDSRKLAVQLINIEVKTEEADPLIVIKLPEKKSQIVGERAGSFSWSPDSRKIAWVQNNNREILVRKYVYSTQYGQRKTGKETIEACDLVISTIEPKISHKVFKPAGISFYDVVWSPDGELIAFVGVHVIPYPNKKITKMRATDLGFVRPDGTGLRFVTTSVFPGKIHPSAMGVMYPSWSPDGKKLAYYHGISHGGHIWTVNRDGSEKKAILALTRTRFWWSPDGKGFLFTRGAGRVVFQKIGVPPHTTHRLLIWINADGTGYKELMTDVVFLNLQWLNDREIAYLSEGTLWRVRIK